MEFYLLGVEPHLIVLASIKISLDQEYAIRRRTGRRVPAAGRC
jgi:hypothetical protein